MFIDAEGVVSDQYESYKQDVVYDDDYHQLVLQEEVVEGVVRDTGPLLMVRRLCYTPRENEGDSWLRSNVFQSPAPLGVRFVDS